MAKEANLGELSRVPGKKIREPLHRKVLRKRCGATEFTETWSRKHGEGIRPAYGVKGRVFWGAKRKPVAGGEGVKHGLSKKGEGKRDVSAISGSTSEEKEKMAGQIAIPNGKQGRKATLWF